jgi:hypothetical protein
MVVFKAGNSGNPGPQAASPEPGALDKLLLEFAARPAAVTLFAGVLLPLAALVAETCFRLCTGIFFNPLPTPLHIALVASVPATNLWTWLALRRG